MNTRLRRAIASAATGAALAASLQASANAGDFGGVLAMSSLEHLEALFTLQGVDPITLLYSAIGEGLLAIAAVALVGFVLAKLID
jgi:hypothetical protein